MYSKNHLVTVSAALSLALGSSVAAAAKDPSKARFTIDNLPDKWQDEQIGTNRCGQWGESNQSSMCQNVFVNSLTDFCLWAPPEPGHTIGETEEEEVAWCTRKGYGTRLIPDGAIKNAHFLKTKSYVQVTGRGDFTNMNIQAGDDGGELDPHGATLKGNPVGGIAWTRAFTGEYEQVHEWMNFMTSDEFCIRLCRDDDPNAAQLCEHIYDVMGCFWVMPSESGYEDGFESCEGDVAPLPGIYSKKDGSVSTFHQGDQHTPKAHKPAASSCKSQATLAVGQDTKHPIPKQDAKQRNKADDKQTITTKKVKPTTTASHKDKPNPKKHHKKPASASSSAETESETPSNSAAASAVTPSEVSAAASTPAKRSESSGSSESVYDSEGMKNPADGSVQSGAENFAAAAALLPVALMAGAAVAFVA